MSGLADPAGLASPTGPSGPASSTGQRLRHLPRGIWGLLATPFTEGGDVDEESLVRLVEYYGRLDLSGMTLLGVFGEAADLTPDERRRVVALVRERAPGARLVIGVTALGTEDAIAEIRNVEKVAGDAVDSYLVQLNSADPGEVVAHYRRLHEATGARIVAQDYPAVSSVHMGREDLLTVVREAAMVSAVKLESVPTPGKVAYLSAGADVPVFGGLGGSYLLDELECGAAGAMTGFTAPEGLIACWRAYLDGGFTAAAEAWAPYLPLVNFEFQPGLARTLRKEGFRARGLFTTSVSRTGAAEPTEELRRLVLMHHARLPGRSAG
ncbi:dihydrodipicolinate synthase family protein [Streptomyces sp. NPDC004610]|uniref:dihydrodipicolinate synthase family protein n=1 Tax=unclassified Streptomyces TaxID=2593676 RepID=UPI0033BD4A7C